MGAWCHGYILVYTEWPNVAVPLQWLATSCGTLWQLRVVYGDTHSIVMCAQCTTAHDRHIQVYVVSGGAMPSWPCYIKYMLCDRSEQKLHVCFQERLRWPQRMTALTLRSERDTIWKWFPLSMKKESWMKSVASFVWVSWHAICYASYKAPVNLL